MNAQELFRTINKFVEELDFVSARKYMEQNIELLKGSKHRLHKNALELFEFVMNKGDDTLTPNDLNAIHVINSYATSFNIRGLKLIVKDKAALVNRKDALSYLNEDAKALLESMNIVSLNA